MPSGPGCSSALPGASAGGGSRSPAEQQEQHDGGHDADYGADRVGGGDGVRDRCCPGIRIESRSRLDRLERQRQRQRQRRARNASRQPQMSGTRRDDTGCHGPGADWGVSARPCRDTFPTASGQSTIYSVCMERGGRFSCFHLCAIRQDGHVSTSSAHALCCWPARAGMLQARVWDRCTSWLALGGAGRVVIPLRIPWPGHNDSSSQVPRIPQDSGSAG